MKNHWKMAYNNKKQQNRRELHFMRMILNIYEYNKYFCVFVFAFRIFALLLLHLLYLFSAYAFISYHHHQRNRRTKKFTIDSALVSFCLLLDIQSKNCFYIRIQRTVCASIRTCVHADSLSVCALLVYRFILGVFFATNNTRKMENRFRWE